MAKIDPNVAALRVAVRKSLAELPQGSLALVACSGGPDSMALADACAFVARRGQVRIGLITVDHGLQEGSASRAAQVAQWGSSIGLAPVEVAEVTVGAVGGPEAAARHARYAALDAAARRYHAAAVLLGHTRDDQAETVLLGLARGSGARSLAGMAYRRGVYRRPLLDLERAVTHAVCSVRELPVWHDPHNTDPAYSRSRLRQLLPVIEQTIGPGVVAGLARSAQLLRADSEYLDSLASDLAARVTNEDGSLSVASLITEPAALRRRVLHKWLCDQGSPSGLLGSVHIAAVEALVTHWRGQGPVFVPGGFEIYRHAGKLLLGLPRG